MPEKKTFERATRDRRRGKSASTQAGAFVREEIEHIRKGKHGARSTRQVIAIGLSKARRAGVRLKPPKRGTASVRHKAKQDLRRAGHRPSATRSRGVRSALRREGRRAATRAALSRQARLSARRRGPASRRAAARRAATTRKR